MNNNNLHFIALLFIVLISGCGSDQKGANELDTMTEYQLIWSDEFNQDGMPSASNWTFDLGTACETPAGCGWGNREIQTYTNDSTNVYVRNGHLFISAIKDDEGQWTSARIKSQGLQKFKYGKMQIRAKLPVGSGTWPALWMLGEDIDTKGWPVCGEIDIMEATGKSPDHIQSALHNPASFGNTQNIGKTQIEGFGEVFHIYTLEWTPEEITFQVDDHLYYTYMPELKDEKNWPYDKNFFVIMNIAMGGNMGSDPQYETAGLKDGVDPALTSAAMEIDYIRFYQKVKSSKL